MNLRSTPAVVGAVAAMSLGMWGCATKKHVAQAIAPVQQQVNQVQQQSNQNKTAIGDLDRQVAQADEKATDAGKRADAANGAAQQANGAAQQANSAAQQAAQQAAAAQQGVNQVNQTISNLNLDNYSLVTSQQVFFRSGSSTLNREAKAALDQIAQNLGNTRNIVIEVEGFTDRTGGRAANIALAQRRADAVVRYLTVDHNVPLRNIRELGIGSEFPNANNRTRAARKENRRVDVKVYSLALPGQNPNGATSQMGTSTPTANGTANGYGTSQNQSGTNQSNQYGTSQMPAGSATGTSSQNGRTTMPTLTEQGNAPNTPNTSTGTSDRTRQTQPQNPPEL